MGFSDCDQNYGVEEKRFHYYMVFLKGKKDSVVLFFFRLFTVWELILTGKNMTGG